MQIIVGNNKSYALGRNRPPVPHAFHLKDFEPNLAAFGTVPSSTGFTSIPAAQPVLRNILGNGTYGCCTEADQYHRQAARQAVASLSDPSIVVYDASVNDVLATYGRDTGFTLADPNSDQGADETVVLANAVQYGITSGPGTVDRAAGSMQLDETNRALYRACLTFFGPLVICMELPDSVTNNIPSGDGYLWSLTKGGVYVPNPNSGHCYTFGDQTDTGNEVIWTWAMKSTATDDFIAAGCSASNGGALYAELDAQMLPGIISQSPDALNWQKMVTAWQAAGGAAPSGMKTVPNGKGGFINVIVKEAECLVEWVEAKLGRKL